MFLKILFITLAVLIFLVLAAAAVSAFYHRQRKSAKDREKLSPRRELEAHLKDITFKKNVFSMLYYPVRAEGTGKIKKYQRVDSVVVCRGGVIVLTVCDKGGRIDNSNSDIWTQIKDDERFDFESPQISADICKDIISAILRRAGYAKIPVYSSVVFTDSSSIPLAGDDNILYMTELEKLISDLNKLPGSDKLEQFFICKAIKNEGLTKDEIVKKKL